MVQVYQRNPALYWPQQGVPGPWFGPPANYEQPPGHNLQQHAPGVGYGMQQNMAVFPGMQGDVPLDNAGQTLRNLPWPMLLGEVGRRFHDSEMQPQVMEQNMVPFGQFMNRQQIPAIAELKKMCPKVVFHGNHVYLCTHPPDANTVYGNFKCWRDGCRARIHYYVFTHEVKVANDEHRRECDVEFYNMKQEAREFLEQCRKFVEEYYYGHRAATAGEIYQELAKTVSEHFKCDRISYLVTSKNVDYWMSDIRSQRESGLPSEMADPFLGGRMIKWVRSDDRTGLILFMSELNQQFLEQATVWQIDGTFKCAPRSFAQCLNIMAVNVIRKTYVPVAHILMKARDHEAYSIAIGRFMEQLPIVRELPVHTIIIDFERALRTGIENALRSHGLDEKIRVRGCLFHYAQAIYRQFKRLIGTSPSAVQKDILSVLLALPYMPIETWERWIYEIQQCETGCERLLAYFHRQWMSISTLWLYDFDTVVTTNCALEGFHGNFGHVLNHDHPSTVALSQALFEMDVSCYHRVVNNGGIHVEPRYENLSHQIRLRQPFFEMKMSELLRKCGRKQRVEEYAGEEITQGPDVSYEETFAVLEACLCGQ